MLMVREHDDAVLRVLSLPLGIILPIVLLVGAWLAVAAECGAGRGSWNLLGYVVMVHVIAVLITSQCPIEQLCLDRGNGRLRLRTRFLLGRRTHTIREIALADIVGVEIMISHDAESHLFERVGVHLRAGDPLYFPVHGSAGAPRVRRCMQAWLGLKT